MNKKLLYTAIGVGGLGLGYMISPTSTEPNYECFWERQGIEKKFSASGPCNIEYILEEFHSTPTPFQRWPAPEYNEQRSDKYEI